jgi:ABC-2 type transport system permease protein
MNAAAQVDTAPGSAAPPSVKPLPATLLTLIRREFWENRALWLAPLAVAALLVLAALLGHYRFNFGDDRDLPGGVLNPEQRVAVFTIVQWGLSVPLYVVMLCCVTYYLTECLYVERRDRSILFWKSLPVSDGLTVLAKMLVALVVVPFGVFALAIAAHLAFTAILDARVALGTAPAVLSWSTLEWLRTEAAMLATLTLAVLWYAPVAGYLLLVSAWARRSPLLWSSLPLLLAPLLERIAFGTHYVLGFIRYRSLGIWGTLALGHGHIFGHFSDLRPVGSLLETLRWGAAFADRDLWLGVIAAAAMAWGAARIRRYRDET